MFLLQLNPMTHRAESVQPICIAESKESLVNFLITETVEEPYNDNSYLKYFKKGSILEWYNPPDETGEAWIDVPAIVDIGTVEDWKMRAEEQYNDLISSLIKIN